MKILQHFRSSLAGVALLALVFSVSAFGSGELDKKLFEVVSYNEPAEISRLIKEGANPNHVVAGTPIITVATVHGSLDAIKALLAGGADPNLKDDGGKTPLMFGAEVGEIDVVKTLLENNADPNIKQDSSGDTVLMKALASSHTLEMITALLDGGADPTLADDSGLTPVASAELHTASPEVIELLAARSKGK
jgi:ankyrin repeat protein